jgi:hypothetical protein
MGEIPKLLKTLLIVGSYLLLSVAGIVFGWMVLGGAHCKSADDRIAAKNLDCEAITKDNKMSLVDKKMLAGLCCLQLMSSKSGSDSKDAACKELIDGLAVSFDRQERKEIFQYCFENNKAGGEPRKNENNCWDKIKP